MSATIEAAYSAPPVAGFRPRRRDLVLFVPLALTLGYLASPYVALVRLACAIRSNDVAVLASAIAWNDMRADLASQLGGAVVQNASATVPAAGDDLPDFGSSFASSATSNAISTSLTPESLHALLGGGHAQTGNLMSEARALLAGGAFHGPAGFDLTIAPDPATTATPVCIHLAFTWRHGWRVERVHLPPAYLDGDVSRT